MSPHRAQATSREFRHDRPDLESTYSSCYDRMVVTGALPTVCHVEGMTRSLCAATARASGATRLSAAGMCVEIEHIVRSHIREEAVVAKVLERRGIVPVGLARRPYRRRAG